jgi:hypothetical protein
VAESEGGTHGGGWAGARSSSDEWVRSDLCASLCVCGGGGARARVLMHD